jgi:auxin responsive GH3 family protein
MVPHHTSFLLLHALFALADRSVENLRVLFCTFMYMDRDWSTLVDAIEKGIVPDFENIEHVREHLEASMNLYFPAIVYLIKFVAALACRLHPRR